MIVELFPFFDYFDDYILSWCVSFTLVFDSLYSAFSLELGEHGIVVVLSRPSRIFFPLHHFFNRANQTTLQVDAAPRCWTVPPEGQQ